MLKEFYPIHCVALGQERLIQVLFQGYIRSMYRHVLAYVCVDFAYFSTSYTANKSREAQWKYFGITGFIIYSSNSLRSVSIIATAHCFAFETQHIFLL